jgi:transposase
MAFLRARIQDFVPAPPLVGVEPNPGPRGNKHLDKETRWWVVFYVKEEQLTYNEIASKLNISRNSVRAIWAKYEETKSVENRPRSGRKRKLSVEQEGEVVRKAKSGKTAPDIARSMKNKVSVDTIQRTLKTGGLKYLKVLETEHLTDVQKANRLQCAKEMLGFDWTTALFSDEKTFWLGSTTTHAWQDPKDRKHKGVEKKTGHRPKIQVWAGAGYYIKTKLFIFEEILSADLYRTILRSRLPEKELTYSPRSHAVKRKWVSVQDNDLKHTAKKNSQAPQGSHWREGCQTSILQPRSQSHGGLLGIEKLKIRKLRISPVLRKFYRVIGMQCPGTKFGSWLTACLPDSKNV